MSDFAGSVLLVLVLLHDALSRDLRLEKGFAPDERSRHLTQLQVLQFGANVIQFLVMFIGTNEKFSLEDQLVGGFVRMSTQHDCRATDRDIFVSLLDPLALNFEASADRVDGQGALSPASMHDHVKSDDDPPQGSV